MESPENKHLPECHSLPRLASLNVISDQTLVSLRKAFWSNEVYWDSLVHERFSRLISLDMIEQFISSEILRYPSVKLYSRGVEINPQNYVNEVSLDDEHRDYAVHMMRFKRLYCEGATVMGRSLNRYSNALWQLCEELGKEFFCRASVNAYLTPPRSSGFDFHSDPHDVIIFQVEGEKDWTVQIKHAGKPGELRGVEMTLKAGNMLFIPRGVFHSAKTSDLLSLHLTIGLVRPTWKTLMSGICHRVIASMPECDEPLPESVLMGGGDGVFGRWLNEFSEAALDSSVRTGVLSQIQEVASVNSPPKPHDINLSTSIHRS